MRLFSAAVFLLPFVTGNETSLSSKTRCYSKHNAAFGDGTSTSHIAPSTKYLTRTRTVTEIPILQAQGEESASTSTLVSADQYTTTVLPGPGFTPIKNSPKIRNVTGIETIPSKKRRRNTVIPKTPRKQNRRTINQVVCGVEVENVAYTTETVTQTATLTDSGSSGGIFSTVTGTFAAPTATYYPACDSTNMLSEWNGTTISRVWTPFDNDLVYVEAADVYSCCVACFETIGNFTCAGYAFGGHSYNGATSPNCGIYGGAYNGDSCHPDIADWGYWTGYSDVWSGPYEIGNGDCGQVAWLGTAPSIDS